MNAKTMVISLGAGFLLVACGGSHSDTTGSTSAAVSTHAHAQDGGHGKACKPADGGISPCARGDGGDDQGDDDGGDDQGDNRDGAARGDGGHGDQGDQGDQGDAGEDDNEDHGDGGTRARDGGARRGDGGGDNNDDQGDDS